jgi:hypothetical protein
MIPTFRWITIPYFGSSGFIIGVVLFLILLVCSICSMLPVLSGGGITKRERNRRIAFLGRCVLFSPLLCVFAVLTFIAPLKRPIKVVLVSRSRPESLDSTQREALLDDTRKVIRRVAVGLDVGSAVDSILAELTAKGRLWRRDDLDQQSDIKVVVLRELDSMSTESHRLDTLDISSSPNLPRWVVESVELAFLKAMTQRFNVEEITLVLFDRITDSGRVWAEMPDYLSNGTIRTVGTRVEDMLWISEARRPQIRFARLVSNSGTSLDIELWVEIPGCASCAGPEKMSVQLSSADATLMTKDLLVSASASGKVQKLEFVAAVPWPPNGDLYVGTLDPPIVLPLALQQNTKAAPIEVSVRSPKPDLWQKTISTLQGSGDGSVEAWKTRMAARGDDVSLFRFRYQDCSVAPGRGIVINDCFSAVMVHPASMDIRNPKLTSTQLPQKAGDILRGRISFYSMPGVDSMAGVSLAPGPYFTFAPVGGLKTACDLAYVDEYGKSLEDGSGVQNNSHYPLVQRFTLGDRAGITLQVIGTSPTQQKVFMAAQAGPVDPAPFFGFWTLVLDSVRAASKPPGQVCGAAMEFQEPANPVAVLCSADMQAIQGRGLQVPLFLVIASLVFLGLFFGLSVNSFRD